MNLVGLDRDRARLMSLIPKMNPTNLLAIKLEINHPKVERVRPDPGWFVRAGMAPWTGPTYYTETGHELPVC